jgi:MFS family permease
MIDRSHEVWRGWPVLAAAVICMLLVFGVPTFSLPFLFRSVIEEFGWTREQATLIASLKFTTGIVVALVLGRVIDRIGVGVATVVIGGLGGLAMLSMKWIGSLSAFYAAGICLGVATSGIMLATKILVSHMFKAHQGTALGIALTGSSIASVIVPFTVAPLIHSIGWRAAMAMMGLVTLVTVVPVAIFLARYARRHESASHADTAPVTSAHAAASERADTAGSGYSRLIRSRDFWFIAIGLAAVGAIDQGLNQHKVLYLETDVGMDPQLVQYGVGLAAFLGAISKLAFGILYDRISTRGIMVVYALLGIAALSAIPVTGAATMFLFLSLRGLAHGGLIVDVPVVSKHVFGPRQLGTTIGALTAAVHVGYATGPWIMGYVFDTLGSYRPALLLFAALGVLACVLLVPVKPVYWEATVRARRAAIEQAAESIVTGQPGRPS